MAVVFVLTLPFLSKVDPKIRHGGPLLLRDTMAGALKSYCGGGRACATKPVETCTRFWSASPLGPSHHRSPDPCASNVNNPAFPEHRGGASVKKWREAVKYREIQQ